MKPILRTLEQILSNFCKTDFDEKKYSLFYYQVFECNIMTARLQLVVSCKNCKNCIIVKMYDCISIWTI